MDAETPVPGGEDALRGIGERWWASILAFVSLLVVNSSPGAAQTGEDQDCGGRASLQVTVTDESGTTLLPAAMVVARWTVETELSAREMTGAEGRVRICAPADVAGAVLWAEFGEG